MNIKENESQKGRWSKLKRVLKKGAKKLIPVAAGWAAGMFFPPAGNILYTFLKNKMADTGVNISFADELLKKICEDTVGNKSVEYLKEKLRKMLESGSSLNAEQLEMTLETLLRPVNESLDEAMDYIRDYPEQISYLMEEWKEENRELIQQLNLNMEAGFDDIKATITEKNVEVLNGIDKMLKEFMRLERKMDSAFAKNVHTIFSTETISELDLELVSRAQLAMARYHSKFGIPFNSDLFVPRNDADGAFIEYLEDILSPFSMGRYLFIVLAEAGMGKTWTLASWSGRLSQKEFKSEELGNYVPFFISLRKGFEMQFSGFFGASNKLDALSNLRKASLSSGLKPILFLDGLDEIIPSEAKAVLNFITDILKEKIPVVLSSRDSDWSREEKIVQMHKELKEVCFEHPQGESIVIQGVSCKPSVYLEEFTEKEFKHAIKKYGLSYDLLEQTHLLKMAKKPILLRLFSEFHTKHGYLPDAKDAEEFETIFLGEKDAPPESYILGRLGIIGTRRDYLLRVIGRFSDKRELSEFELTELKKEREDFSILKSSGLLIQNWGGYKTEFSLNELYYPHLKNWAEKAGILSSFGTENMTSSSSSGGEPIDDATLKTRQRCDYLIGSARNYLTKGEHEDALERLRQSRKLCDEELFDNDLLMSIDSLIKRVEEARNYLEDARGTFEKENWGATIDLASKAEHIFTEFDDSHTIRQAEGLISRAENKIKEREDLRRDLRLKSSQLLSEGETHLNSWKWDAAIESILKAKKICKDYGWIDCIEKADSMIDKAKHVKEIYKIVSFKGAKISKLEADVLQALETQLGKQFMLVNQVEYNTQMGFSVGNNRVTGIGLYNCGVSTLPESITKLTSLERLDLAYNKLSTLPESITKLTSLEELYLMRNQLSTLPESIGDLKSLNELDLRRNKLSTLPESISNLKSLKELHLDFNKLSTLPESITKLTSLEELYLEWNNLSTLLKSIGNLISLEKLNLHNNKLSTLPESIGNLKSLEILYLWSNDLTTLPESMINISSLKTLDVSGNLLDSRAKSVLKQLKKNGVNVST